MNHTSYIIGLLQAKDHAELAETFGEYVSEGILSEPLATKQIQLIRVAIAVFGACDQLLAEVK